MSGRSTKAKVLIGATDVLLASVALYGSYLIRFDFDIRPVYKEQLWSLLPMFLLVRVALLYYSGGYGFIWRYASISDLLRIARAVALGTAVLAIINFFRNYPLGLLLAGGLFLSVVAHRGTIHLRARQVRRTLGLFLVAAAVGGLVLGVLAFTVLSSAPMSIGVLPLGESLIALDFREFAAPRGVLVLEAILSFLLFTGVRVAPRLLLNLRAGKNHRGRRTLVYGAGDVGESLVRVLKAQPTLGYFVAGFIDDDESKQRVSIHGVRIAGGLSDLERLIDELSIKELLVAIPALAGDELREVTSVCWKRGVTVRRVPPLSRMVDGRQGVESFAEVDIQDLLGRVEVDLDPLRVIDYLRERTVLVTGAGGSIGSELCRQIARCRPRRLLLLGKGENSIYEISKELTAVAGQNSEVITLIGDVSNTHRMEHVFATHTPDVVFHAAAHKHVPFMEEAADESVRNNVFGTQVVARAALRHGVARFVLISSDKAVRPSSVMGATKRVAELVLKKLSSEGATDFVTVRFGNVLRSRGSVIPHFERQIKSGGPVTVTHPDMVRYFMSIPEAVRLVLHAGAIGKAGDLCVLDMGKPVRIVELAENLITLAGKKPYEEVDIVFTGIRPGEKLTEELLTEQEAATMRQVDKILICKSTGCDWDAFDGQLGRLAQAVESCRAEEAVGVLQDILPEYSRPVLSSGP